MTVWLQFLGCVLIWGSTWIAIKYQIGDVPTQWSVAYRFILAAIILAGVVIVRKLRPSVSLKQNILLIGYGLFQFCLNFQFVYAAEKTVPSGLMAILFALMVITNPVFSRFIFGSRISTATFIGGAVSVLGVALMFESQIISFSWADAGVHGLIIGLLGVLSASIGNIFAAAPELRKLPPMTTNLWAMAYGASASAIYASIAAGPPSFSIAPLYLAGLAFTTLFGSVLGFSFYLNIIRAKGLTVAAYVGVCVPIIALAWSWAINEFQWSYFTFLGIALALAGLLIALKPQTQR
jgi:drug/metabolite transporter (DMT)-like permease